MLDRSSISARATRPSLRPIQPSSLSTFDKNAVLCYQPLAHSSQFAISHISNIFCALRTLCEKHPGVGVPKHSEIADFAFSALNPMESYSFARHRCNRFRILLFRGDSAFHTVFHSHTPIYPVSLTMDLEKA